MLLSDFNDGKLKFPKIAAKSKTAPSSVKSVQETSDMVSAKSWLYCTSTTQYGHKSNVKREIASLTKIMTALCTLQICQKFGMNLMKTYFRVTEWAVTINGTTADLQQNAWMNVNDLLFGLMLPSGNDAATVLSQNLGAVLYFQKSGNKAMTQCNIGCIQIEIRSIDLTEDYQSIKYYNWQFINYMNQKARHIKMNRTRFANPHGLDHMNNYSCCEDVYLMCKEAMSNEIFRNIVKTVSHKGVFKYFNDGKVVTRPIFWTNTNKLLQKQEVVGIKTGITSRAGGCLATIFSSKSTLQSYIVVLGSTSTQARFKDTLRIMNWTVSQKT